MTSKLEAAWIILATLIAGGLLFGAGQCLREQDIRKDTQAADESRRRDEARLACINSGRAWLHDSCVKVAP